MKISAISLEICRFKNLLIYCNSLIFCIILFEMAAVGTNVGVTPNKGR